MISVIIPAYNAEKTLNRCLESLKRQTFRDFEIIIVNDGSRDRTADVAGQWKQTFEGTDIPFIDTVASHNDYKITPLALVQYNGASLTGVTLGSSTELTEVGTTGISAPKTVVTAAATSGKGRFGCDVKLDLNVPANSTAADDYTSTMTFTVV